MAILMVRPSWTRFCQGPSWSRDNWTVTVSLQYTTGCTSQLEIEQKYWHECWHCMRMSYPAEPYFVRNGYFWLVIRNRPCRKHNPKNNDPPKMKTTPKTKTTQTMKTTQKMKTTPKMKTRTKLMTNPKSKTAEKIKMTAKVKTT